MGFEPESLDSKTHYSIDSRVPASDAGTNQLLKALSCPHPDQCRAGAKEKQNRRPLACVSWQFHILHFASGSSGRGCLDWSCAKLSHNSGCPFMYLTRGESPTSWAVPVTYEGTHR